MNRGLLHLGLLAAVSGAFLLMACSGKDKVAYVERQADDLYNSAMHLLEANNYEKAAGLFDEVERQHPYSVWATKGQLMAAYSLYQNNKYDEAIVALDRFVQLHPSNKDTPYALYLKALSYYEQISDVARDKKMTELAMKTLNELTTRYPGSKYARDAKIKIVLTHSHLAGKEMWVGRYYLNQGNYLAAINRFKSVIDKYQTTTHVPEALHRLTEAYLAIGVEEEARKTAAVLGHNYPGSAWYVDTYALFGGAGVPSGDVTEQGREDGAKDKKPWYKFW